MQYGIKSSLYREVEADMESLCNSQNHFTIGHSFYFNMEKAFWTNAVCTWVTRDRIGHGQMVMGSERSWFTTVFCVLW